MKNQINEIKRMQQLAGLNEAFIKDPHYLYDIGDKVYDVDWHLYEDEPTLHTITNKTENAEELKTLGIPYAVDWDVYDDEELNNPWYEFDGDNWFPQSEIVTNPS